ncbi:HlyD family secretion protein [Prevotella sp.]|uniref:HlyD family secretion protein n=1 Tax=Prevotella sp. TaxID=59823 RepID=UPI003076DFBB
MDKKLLRTTYNICVLILLVIGAWLVVNHFVHFGDGEFTDNATVQQHITPVNTRVGGFIKEIRFNEYQPVHKGDTLVIIEDSEFRLQLAQAEANLQREMAGGEATTSGIGVTRQNMSVSDAGIDEARVRLDNARQDDQRYAQLLKADAVTQQQYDQIHTNYLAAKARYEQVVRSRATLNRTEQEQGHRLSQNKAAIDVAQAQIKLARLNLSYTVITATADGVVGKKNIHVGQLVQPGQAMVDIVDNSELWVVANYRETQLPGISLGAKVSIKADAVPDVEFEGTVERISDATGSAFSVIPQDNATGNFVKVEQRIPVRISLEGDKANIARLRAGMNVECTVNK